MFLKEDKVADFLQGVSFTPGTLLEAFAIIGMVAFVALVYFFWQKSHHDKGKRLRELRSLRMFRSFCSNRELTPTEIELMERLSAHLQSPKEEQHLLFLRYDSFSRCENALLQERPDAAQNLIRLRVRLGFAERAQGKPLRSTAEIPQNTEFRLQGAKARFSLRKTLPEGMEIGMVAGKGPFRPAPERRLSFTFTRSDGVYHFTSHALKNEGERNVLQHVALQRTERRKFFRRNTVLEADFGGVRCRIIDIGGGGCRIEPPGGGFSAGETLPLRFALPGPGRKDIRIKAEGRIVEAVNDAKRLHVAFVKIREGDRDSIYRHILRGTD